MSLSSGGLDLPIVEASLEKHGLRCLTGLAVPGAVWDDRRGGALRRYLMEAVDATAALGAGILSGALYTPMGERADPGRRSDELRHVRADLKEVAQYAAALGVRLGLEPLNRYETSLVNTCEQMLELIADVDEANLFVHLDTFHMNIEERSLRAAIVTAGEQLGYIQLAESDRGVPGTGLSGTKCSQGCATSAMRDRSRSSPSRRRTSCSREPPAFGVTSSGTLTSSSQRAANDARKREEADFRFPESRA